MQKKMVWKNFKNIQNQHKYFISKGILTFFLFSMFTSFFCKLQSGVVSTDPWQWSPGLRWHWHNTWYHHRDKPGPCARVWESEDLDKGADGNKTHKLVNLVICRDYHGREELLLRLNYLTLKMYLQKTLTHRWQRYTASSIHQDFWSRKFIQESVLT